MNGGVFETETMAELCIKQGLAEEGLQIYRRLVSHAPDEVTRARRQRRLGELERSLGGPRTAPPPEGPLLEAPALRVGRMGEELTLEWNLPAGTRAPAVQLLLVRQTPDGIKTEARTVPLDGARGRTTLRVPELHSLRAAAGWLDGERFVPVVRT